MSGTTYVLSAVSLSAPLVSVTKGSGTPSVANKTIKQDILISIRVALGMHGLGNSIRSQCRVGSTLKLDNILVCVTNRLCMRSAKDFRRQGCGHVEGLYLGTDCCRGEV